MKLAIAITGAVLGVCAAAGAICFANYAKTTDKPTIGGFFDAAKKCCAKCTEEVCECAEAEEML